MMAFILLVIGIVVFLLLVVCQIPRQAILNRRVKKLEESKQPENINETRLRETKRARKLQ